MSNKGLPFSDVLLYGKILRCFEWFRELIVYFEQGNALFGCVSACKGNFQGVLNGSENESIDTESLLDLFLVGRNFKNDHFFIKYELGIDIM